MFNIGKTDAEGRQARIEHRGRHLRASRTGGISLRAQTRAAGLNLTANTSEGMRASNRVAKGTNVFFQNGRFGLRGRYGKGPVKLNVAKSGATVSTKTGIGTFNFLKPNRSSVKVGGIQVRGKKAARLQLVYLIFQFLLMVVQLAVSIVLLLGQVLLRAAEIGIEGTRRLVGETRAHALERWEEALPVAPSRFTAAEQLAALAVVILVKGRGREEVDTKELATELRVLCKTAEAPESLAPLSNLGEADLAKGREMVEGMVFPGTTDPRKAYAPAVGLLAANYAEATSPGEALAAFYALDEAAVQTGARNRLQEQLLAAAGNGIGLEVEA